VLRRRPRSCGPARKDDLESWNTPCCSPGIRIGQSHWLFGTSSGADRDGFAPMAQPALWTEADPLLQRASTWMVQGLSRVVWAL